MTKTKIINTKIGIFSFFAGAGFLDLGFETTKYFKTLFVNEFHQPFMDVYKYARKGLLIDEPIFGYSNDDVCSFIESKNSSEIADKIKEAKHIFDLIGFIGGPPCPDFSIGGKNRGSSGENGRLSATYIELILRNRPDFFLFENVKGLYRTSKHRSFFDLMKRKLRAGGYYLTEHLINAIEFGAPQDRERIILIGFRESTLIDYGVRKNDSSNLVNFDWGARTRFNAKEIFSQNWPLQEQYQESSVKNPPDGIELSLTVQHWFELNDVENHPNANNYFKPRAGLARFISIPEGDDLKKSYKRLHRWRYSPTAAYGNNEVHLHPYKPRRISVAEALAIQSLPKNFVIPQNISLTNMFKTVGNGVPFLAAKGLAETLALFIKKNMTNRIDYEKVIS